MCGIAGIFNRNGAPADEGLLRRMAERMRLRGPDGEEVFTGGEFGLAHRRLSIIDLAGGAQPLFNEDRTIAFVHNGEIYNHRELRAGLEKAGHRFRTNSDSECIGHLYEEYGMDFPSHLEGMFAIAIADLRKRKMILATDRAGKKPVFYFIRKGTLCFASTLPALGLHPEMPHDLNLQGIWDYMSFLCIPAPDTVFQHVHKLPPAYTMTFSPATEYPDFRCYWKPDFSGKTTASFGDCAAELRKRMTESVLSRLESEVPLGVFLSGGLDSAVVASIVSKVPSSVPLKCFSIGFDDPAYDESAGAAATAEFLRRRAAREIEFHHRTVKPDDFETLEFLCSEYGEPFADASLLPTHLLCGFARENVTVALSGDGADEIFAGYERYRALNLLSMFDSVPRFLRRGILNFAGRIDASAGERTFAGRLKRFLNVAAVPPEFHYPALVSKCSASMKKNIMGAAFGNFVPQKTIRFWSEWRKLSTAACRVERAMEYDWNFYLANDILPKVDTSSMSASMEVRCPFLDRRIVEFAASLPVEYKLRGSRRKRILAEAFRADLPPGLGSVRKRGFGVPVSAWLRGPWRERMTEAILEGLAVNRFELFRRDMAEYMIREHCSGKADFGYPLYLILALELSLRKR